MSEPDKNTLELRLLGGCEILVHGQALPAPRYRKEWWLLALLALRQGRAVSRDALAADFWPDSDPDRALLYLRRSLTNLRRALGPEAARLQSPTPRTLRLDLDGAWADAVAFDRLARPDGPEDALAQAVALYAGPLLPDCDEPWALPERAARAQAYLSALEALAERARARGDAAGAAGWLRRALAADPLRESAAAALMRALADAGDRAAAAGVYRDLRRRLRQDRNADPAPETRRLMEALRMEALKAPGDAPPPPAPPPPAPSGRHLPVPLTDLVGRGREVAEVAGWLRRSRLVTLTGEGGIGKTRLAVAAAEAALPNAPDGAWFVDLAPLGDPSLVPEAVAQALGLREGAGRPAAARLAEALAPSAGLLLVLDNCEHVLDACASLVGGLLPACPRLRALATSRQALGVAGERVYAVPPLGLPPPEPLGPPGDPDRGEKNVAALLESGAVRLFVERASQAAPAFRLTRRNADAVAEVCRRLDGLPLALELAAARVRALSPSEICARLGDRLGLLAAGNRGAPPRQQTLRAAIDWSHALLPAPERALLRRLSVFAGGWDAAAAEAVCGGDALAGDVPGGLASLVDKSLVSAETVAAAAAAAAAAAEDGGERTRYRLRETVRQYARDRLAEAGEEAGARARHRDEFAGLAAAARPHMQGPGLGAWLDRLEREHDNLRAALDGCLHGGEAGGGEAGGGEAGGAALGLRLASDLFFLWWVRGYFAEGRRWYEAVLAHPDAQARTPARAKALSRAGGLLLVSGEDAAAARPFFDEGLGIAQECGDRKQEANLWCNLGDLASAHDPAGARDFLARSLALHRALGNPPGVAHAALLLGNVAQAGGHTAEAQALYAESLALYRGLGNPQKTGHALWCLARAAIDAGDPTGARALLAEAVGLFRALGDLWGLSAALALAGEAALRAGDPAGARPALAEHLALVRRMGLRRSAPWALRCFGRLAVMGEEWARAARLFGAAEALGAEASPALSPAEAEAAAACRAALGPAAFAAAWAAGGGLPLEQAADEALRGGA